MVQILPKTSLGQRLGTALGTGLGAGITGLAQNKLAEIERQRGIQQTQSGLQALGLPKEIAGLPENLQSIALKQILQGPSQQNFGSILNSLINGTQAEGQIQPNLSGLNERQASELAKLGLQQRKAQQQEKQFQTKESRIQQHHIDKETKPYYDESFKAYKGARSTNPVLARMQTLLNNNNLPNPAFYSLANKVGGVFGLNLGSLQSADAQEFEKLTNEFLKNAKDIFGSRLTNFDVQTFLKGIPSLSQTNEGKQRIINNLRTINEGALLKYNALKQVISENGGNRPANLSELVEERVEPQLDDLAERFAQGTPLGKPIRAAEDLAANKIVSAQQQSQGNTQEELPPHLRGNTAISAIPKSTLGEAARHVGRVGARIAEGVAGRFTAIPSLALQGANLLAEKTLGQGIPYHEQIQKAISPETYTEFLAGENIKPKTENEKYIDNLASEFGAFVGNPAQGIAKMLARAGAKVGLGNLASYLTKSLGGGEKTQTGVKIGTQLLSSLFGGRRDLTKIATKGYDTVQELAKGKSANAIKLLHGAEKVSDKLKHGIETSERTFLLPKVKEIIDKIKKYKIPGSMSVSDAVKIEQNLNKYLRDVDTPKEAKHYLEELKNYVKAGPLANFSKRNPTFGKTLNDARDLYRGLNQSSKITTYLKKHINVKKISDPLVKTILLGGALYKIGAPLTAAGVGTAFGVRELSKFIDLLKNSSQARKYYAQILSGAVKEQANVVNRNAQNLDKIATSKGY